MEAMQVMTGAVTALAGAAAVANLRAARRARRRERQAQVQIDAMLRERIRPMVEQKLAAGETAGGFSINLESGEIAPLPPGVATIGEWIDQGLDNLRGDDENGAKK